MWSDFPEQVAEATRCGALLYSRAGYGGSDTIVLPRSVNFMSEEGLIKYGLIPNFAHGTLRNICLTFTCPSLSSRARMINTERSVSLNLSSEDAQEVCKDLSSRTAGTAHTGINAIAPSKPLLHLFKKTF
jgi:hypothetical protein